MSLEEILTEYLYKRVHIELSSRTKFEGHLIGIKLPVSGMIMLYFVEDKHAEKYAKHFNSRWVQQMPFEMIKSIEILNGSEELAETFYYRCSLPKKSYNLKIEYFT